MAKYYPVVPKYWPTARKRKWKDREKLLGLYLLTCEHRNLEGLYYLPVGYVGGDLGWSDTVVSATLQRLVDDGFCEYDEAAAVVLVTNSLEHQAPKSPKQVAGAVSAIEKVPDSPLLASFMEIARRHAPLLWKALNGNPLETHSDEIGNPSETHGRGGSSSSSSSSSSIPPVVPLTGDEPAMTDLVGSVIPRKPGGGRQRDKDEYARQLAAWVAANRDTLLDPHTGRPMDETTLFFVVDYVLDRAPEKPPATAANIATGFKLWNAKLEADELDAERVAA